MTSESHSLFPYRWLGLVLGVGCWFAIGLSLWSDPPIAVPTAVAVAAGWIGFCLGAVVETASRRG